jgi:hypothetical protein
MRDVLSASLAGTALLSLSSSLVWPRQPQQRLLAMHPQRLWVASPRGGGFCLPS